MAAISLIAGSVLGWLCAVVALLAGALGSTALIVFLGTSLGTAGVTLFLAHLRCEGTA